MMEERSTQYDGAERRDFHETLSGTTRRNTESVP